MKVKKGDWVSLKSIDGNKYFEVIKIQYPINLLYGNSSPTYTIQATDDRSRMIVSRDEIKDIIKRDEPIICVRCRRDITGCKKCWWCGLRL